MSNAKHDVIITGVPPPPGVQPTAYQRRPIEELVKDEKQFSLYVQAMDEMMKAGAKDMLSWFQVGGIHGAPALPWDNVAGIANPSWLGYCTHASVLFPTWHRPYVLLFEQALVGFALKIAARYQGADAAEWREAAAALRSPYWDWARVAVPPPEVIEYATLTVRGPDGDVVLNPNPLLGYQFKRDEPDVDPRPRTVRCPTRANPNASNLAALTTSLRVLDNPNDPMHDRVYNTLNDAHSWETFSNKRTSQGAFRNSLESIHDTIHVLVGGNGQMADPSVAAFDPMFWLHHTNVDRLLALWQGLHPDVWVSAVNGPGEGGTFTISRNAHVNQSTDLTPFWNGETTFFKSESPGVRQWQLLNYTYPEFAQLRAGSDTRAAILAEVKKLYLDEEDDDDEEEDLQAPPTRAPAPVAPAPVKHTAPEPVKHTAPAPVKHTAPVPAHPAPHAAAGTAPHAAVGSTAHAVASHVAHSAPQHVHAAPSHPAHAAPAHAAAAAIVGQAHRAAAPKVDDERPAGEGEDTPVTFIHTKTADPHHAARLDWFARIRVKAAKVGQSFTVLLFFGEPPASESEWRSADNLIGVHAEFVNSRPGQCANCQENADVVTEGFIRLTRGLRKRGLYRRPEADVEEFLRTGLEWRIQKIDGTVVEADEITSLEIAVMTVPLEFSHERHGWRKPDEVRPSHRNLTSGRAGGRPLPQ